jgi:flagellar motor protein MotB
VEGAVDHLHTDPYNSDENVSWPSYVDFLATFSFVLFIFIGSLLYMMYGQLGNRRFAAKVAKYVTHLKQQGIEVSVEGQKIKYDLRRNIAFVPGLAELNADQKEYLRRVAQTLPEGLHAAGDCKIVVLGKADSAKFKEDPFGNWSLSARRALAVLQFLYDCANCGYGPEMRGKLVLLGEGDVESTGVGADDRRVDLVIDCTREVAP